MSVRTLQRMAGTCMRMTVATRPASLWTHAMLTAVVDLNKSGSCSVDREHDYREDLVGEFVDRTHDNREDLVGEFK